MLDPTLPQVGDLIPDPHRHYYRTITSVEGLMEDGRVSLTAHDPRTDCLVAMAITPPEIKTPRVKNSPARTDIERPRLTPELRQKISDGLVCRARGHDLTGTLPNGKPAIYVSPKGVPACRWCKLEAAERHASKIASEK